MRTRLLFRKIVGADALTTWGSVTLLSVVAGGLVTCLSTSRGIEVGQAVLIGYGALMATGILTLACAGIVDSEMLSARKQQIETELAEQSRREREESAREAELIAERARQAASERELAEQSRRLRDKRAREEQLAERARLAALEADRLAEEKRGGHEESERVPKRAIAADTSRLKPCKTCGKEVSVTAPTCPHCGETLSGQRMTCPQCQSSNVLAGEKGWSTGRAALFGFLLGPAGVLAGARDLHKPAWICQQCGYRWDR